ncbi:MAG: hydroxymethylbilane synthase [Verrucomicrobiota bacterium]
MSEAPLILGTRGSELALAQARLTESALSDAGIDCEIKVIKTIGDKRPDLKLSEFSTALPGVHDKGVFTKELEEALLSGEIDFAVHSLKDVPTELSEAFEICATLPRAPIADVFLTTEEGLAKDLTLLGQTPNPVKSETKEGMVRDLTLLTQKTVATSSVRRARQLGWLFRGVEVVDIRGNVPTRIRKLIQNSNWTGILLARAGLERLGIYSPEKAYFEFEGTRVFAVELPVDWFLPAAGQGAVGIEILKSNARARGALDQINDRLTFQQTCAERAFLARLEAGCQTPVGVSTWFENEEAILAMKVRVFDESDVSAEPRQAEASGPSADPGGLADTLMHLLEST